MGVASIGPLDYAEGWVRGAPNAPVREFPLRRPIEEALGAPVVLENDVNAAAWGEYLLARRRGPRSLVFVAVGTGIGAGVVVGGRILRGPRGLAGEAGHIVVDPWSGVRCGCGGLGHWEALASGSRLPQAAVRLASSWRGPETPASREASRGRLGYPELARALQGGDPFARHLLGWLARVHAAGLATLTAAYDPDVIVVGGGAALGVWEHLAEPLDRAYRELAPYGRAAPVEPATYGRLAGLYGALALALSAPETCG